jgi:hypothetical protein
LTDTVTTLSLGDRVALAAAATAIRSLPSVLQQYSNSCDMIAMLKDGPAACGRAGYILGQARAIFRSFSSIRVDAIDAIEQERVPELEAFIAFTVACAEREDAFQQGAT